MPRVLVHGNPECDAIWTPLRDALRARGVDDVVCWSPPGFGAPAPEGWGATAPEYGQWLIDELAATDGAIDLVGHDWGAGHVFWVLAHAPGSIRSAATDVAALIHPDYVWHDAAQIWRTPGAGEEFVEGWVDASFDDRVALFNSLGLPPETAQPMAEALDAEMGRCILALYRSAGDDYRRQLIAALDAADRPPWLLIDPGDDPYVPADLGREVGERYGARTVALGGHGHWWMVTAPDAAADALVEFWS